MKFLNGNATNPRSSHDSTIFNESAIGQALRAGRFGENYLIGDSGYACTPYLLTPYATPNDAHKATKKIRIYNIFF